MTLNDEHLQQIELVLSNLVEIRQQMETISAKLKGFERREDLNRRLGNSVVGLTQSVNQLVTAIDRLNLPLTRAQNDVAALKSEFSESRHEQRHALQKLGERLAEVKTVAASLQHAVQEISNKASVISKDLDDVTGNFKTQQPSTKERIAALGFGALAKMPVTVQIVIAVGTAMAVVGGVWGWVLHLTHR